MSEFGADLDEWEQDVERMAAELKAKGLYPDSIRMLDRAVAEHLARRGFPRPIIAEAIFAKLKEDDDE